MVSLMERLLPKSIHAVTAVGFELKVVLFVLAVSPNRMSGRNLLIIEMNNATGGLASLPFGQALG
jgi:hypothetical protein